MYVSWEQRLLPLAILYKKQLIVENVEKLEVAFL